MNRLTVLTDIASRVMHDTIGSPRTVAGGVAIGTSQLAGIRIEVRCLPKWGSCTEDQAGLAVDIMASQAIAVSVVSINRETDAWIKFLEDAQVLHEAIIKTSRKVAGWAKATNLLKFILLGSACAAATGHTLRVDRWPQVVNSSGQRLVECATVCDSEIEGPENLELFKSFWGSQHIPKSRLAKLGIDMVSTEVRVTTEQEEPALLLADYVAGLGLAAVTDEPGRLALPLSQRAANALLERLRGKGKLVMVEEDFAYTYDEIFSDAMARARELADA